MHTKTPWRYHLYRGRWTVYQEAPLGGKGGAISGASVRWTIASGSPQNGECAQANTAFIVKACNAHEALVKALYRCESVIDAHVHHDGVEMCAFAEALEQARAALKSVEEK